MFPFTCGSCGLAIRLLTVVLTMRCKKSRGSKQRQFFLLYVPGQHPKSTQNPFCLLFSDVLRRQISIPSDKIEREKTDGDEEREKTKRNLGRGQQQICCTPTSAEFYHQYPRLGSNYLHEKQIWLRQGSVLLGINQNPGLALLPQRQMGLLFFANYTLQPIIISPLCMRWFVIVGARRKEKEPGFAFSSQNPPHARMVLLFPLSSDNDSSVFESSSAILGISFALIDNDVQWLPLRRRDGILRRQARSENWTIKEVLADCFDLYHAIPLQWLR